jgi:hypothetical protein
MATVEIALRQDHRGDWRLYAPKGHELGGPFRGSELAALNWAQAFVSSWYNYAVKLEGAPDAQEN